MTQRLHLAWHYPDVKDDFIAIDGNAEEGNLQITEMTGKFDLARGGHSAIVAPAHPDSRAWSRNRVVIFGGFVPPNRFLNDVHVFEVGILPLLAHTDVANFASPKPLCFGLWIGGDLQMAASWPEYKRTPTGAKS